jgi:hypothetical protein
MEFYNKNIEAIDRLSDFARDISHVTKLTEKLAIRNDRLVSSNKVLLNKYKMVSVENKELGEEMQRIKLEAESSVDASSDLRVEVASLTERLTIRDEAIAQLNADASKESAFVARLKATHSETIAQLNDDAVKQIALIVQLKDENSRLKAENARLKSDLITRDFKIGRAVEAMKFFVDIPKEKSNSTMIDVLRERVIEYGVDWELLRQLVDVPLTFITGSLITQSMLGERWENDAKSHDIDLITFNLDNVASTLFRAGYQVHTINRGGYGSGWDVYKYAKVISGSSSGISRIVSFDVIVYPMRKTELGREREYLRKMICDFDFTFAWNYFDGKAFYTLSYDSLKTKRHLGKIPESSRTNQTREKTYASRGFTYDYTLDRPTASETILPLHSSPIQ